jgi:hypothetical protein
MKAGDWETQDAAARRGTRREAILALTVAYGLIVAALWTPRPWQQGFVGAALVWVVVETARNFEGWRRLGFGERGFLGSVWVTMIALALTAAGFAVSAKLGTLHAPPRVELFVRRFWTYALWAMVQEFVLLGFFFMRLLRLLESRKNAILVTAGLFTLAHLPNPVLMPLVFVWGLIASAVFLRWRNLYTLGMAHAILGICIAVTVPGRIDHNMRVGLGYLQYRHDPVHQRLYSQRPHTVSTVACVMAEAPTRRP